ncbi:MAG TPA: hypothetical protein VF841_00540 [Anaeromyxobacter sp.]
MTRVHRLLAAALALAVSGTACTKAASTGPGALFRQPSSVAAFRGKTLGNPSAIAPYLAVANQSRNDLTIVNGATDVAVPAPVVLRGLVLSVPNRPMLVAAASLGDGPAAGSVEVPADPSTALPDLLVAVSGGGSVLQLVETWKAANLVHSEPLTDPLAVDLGYDVLALAVVPSPAGTARLAAVLADHRVAVVTYARQRDGAGQTDGSIAPVLPVATSGVLPFQPEAVAAMPGDPALTSLFVATRDPIATDASGKPVYGVEELSLAGLVPVRALGARAPTRLVAAARLKERIFGDWGTGQPLPGSAASDDAAFVGRPEVPRVYAVLDESGCGLDKPIDCGVVALDPTVPSGTQAIPSDRTAGSAAPGDAYMPYRAPMRVPGRPVAIAVSGPPARPPPAVAGEPDFTTSPLSAYMRLYSGSVARATTAVAAVPCDDGIVYYLDLGRFETATGSLAVASKPVSAAMPAYTRPPTCTTSTAAQPRCARRRLWLRPAPDGAFIADAIGASDVVTMTPGWTPDEQWSLVYQGLVAPSGLYGRAGEAGQDAGGNTWVALQTSAGGDTFNQVVRLWDPALGVREGDLLVIKARAVGCTGTSPGTNTDTDSEFYVQVASLVPPDAARYPGGAVTVTRVATDEDPAWATCYGALQDATRNGTVLRGLVVAVRAGGYVLTGTSAGSGGVPVSLGYLGRPQPNVAFTLAYQDEDALAAACPFEQWGWAGPPTPAVLGCDATCRAGCERLAIVRKLRRYQGVSVDCNTNSTLTSSCTTVWPGNAFPLVPGPTALAFTFDLQRDPEDPVDPLDPTVGSTPFRDLRLTILSRSNVTVSGASGKSTSPFQASGMTTFDRSPWTPDAAAGYRFLVSYPADFVLDSSPSHSNGDPVVIR